MAPAESATGYSALDPSPSPYKRIALLAGAGAALFLLGGLADHLALGERVVVPPDYMPKCEGDQTLGVSLEEACERVEAASGGAGARRKLTSVATSYSCLPHFRIPLTGTDGRVTFPYHAEDDVLKGDPELTMALIIIHGAQRDADNYFCAFYDLHKDINYRKPDEVLVIAPDFNYEKDPGVQPSDAYWNTSRPWGDWRAGAHSTPSSGHGITVSSYAVLDTFVQLLSDKALFPKLDLISVVGHSAGGQTVQRYALATSLPPEVRPGLTVRYVVANPSSYAYLDETRPQYTCGECVCNPKECECSAPCAPDGPIHDASLPFVKPARGFSMAQPGKFVCGHAKYDDWPYGLKNRWGYTEEDVGYPMNASLALYPQRDVAYLVGQNDTCNDGLAECDGECWQRDNPEEPCMRNHMDNRCPAMLEGPWRKMRGKTYVKFLKRFYGKSVHHFGIVPGAGHNATAIYTSKIALDHVFRHVEPADDGAPSAPPPATLLRRYPNIAARLAADTREDDVDDAP